MGRVVNICPPIKAIMLTLQEKYISRMISELWKSLSLDFVFHCHCSLTVVWLHVLFVRFCFVWGKGGILFQCSEFKKQNKTNHLCWHIFFIIFHRCALNFYIYPCNWASFWPLLKLDFRDQLWEWKSIPSACALLGLGDKSICERTYCRTFHLELCLLGSQIVFVLCFVFPLKTKPLWGDPLLWLRPVLIFYTDAISVMWL